MNALIVQWMSIDISGTEAATGGVLYKKVFLKTLQNLQENTCVGVSFSITKRLRQKRLRRRCFSLNFQEEFLCRTPSNDCFY